MTTTTDAVATGIWRIPVPLSDSPLGTVNAYLIDNDRGPVLIDTGWYTPEAEEAIVNGLAAADYRPSDLSLIVLTHGHPDHAGQAAWLHQESAAPVLLHPGDLPMVDPARRDGEFRIGRMAAWMLRNGLPNRQDGDVRGSRRSMADRNPPFFPDALLEEGETLPIGDYRFQVLWCPGHAPGEVVLYDERSRLLIAGDHVLPAISPNVGIFAEYDDSDDDPLGQYLASLARVRDLAVDCALPGHGPPFGNFAARVDEIAAHHEERLAEILAELDHSPTTAYVVSRELTWAGQRQGWQLLPPFQQAMALAETIAHLELLRRRKLVQRDERDGVLHWRRT